VRSRTYAGARPRKAEARPVSKPGDRHEREAERAADVVARGGSVSSWSFSAVPASAPDPVQREETGKPKTDDEKKKEAVTKAAEAALETKPGKELKEKVLADPVVKTVKDAVTTPAGLAVAGAAIGGGVAALGAAKKPLPFQPPSIPLDKITPGLSADVKLEGPVNSPTFVGLSLTYKEQGPKAKKKSGSDDYAAETARLRARLELAKPEAQKAAEKQEADDFVQAWVARQRFTIPLTPGAAPRVEDAPKDEAPKKEEEKAPVQPAPASPSAAPPAHANVDDALSGAGRPLDPSTRRSMEARFGYDFSGVRVHDDARAAATAAGIDAAAFAVGEDVVFGTGRYDPAGAEGRRLLAHELAHVVQASRGRDPAATTVHRRSIFESLGILLGLEEGTWEDRELHSYLDAVTRSGQIEGSYDSDNKARAIVRRWKASSPGFDLLPRQKVLLIREMLDGPTLGEDETCILDLLELSDASDLRAIFGTYGVSLTALESDINGDNRTRLDTFVSSRFDGGRDAVLAGRIEVLGDAVPAGAPRFGFDAAALDARFDSDRSVEDLIALIAAMPDADRAQALHHLVAVRRPQQLALLDRVRREYAAEHDPARRTALQETGRRYRREMLKTERVILHFLRDAVPATADDLRNGTSPTDPSRQAELQEALRPPRHAAATFRPTLPGETETYEQKIRAHLPALVDEYYQGLVAGHGPAEHRDTAQTHTLVEFEAIGNVAKNETDGVFGRFYAPADHPPLRADRPRRRGTVHDQFAETERRLARMTRGQRADMAKTLIFYFFQSDEWARRLNHDHDAAPRFDDDQHPLNDEATAIDTVATEFVRDRANVTRLNEIDRNWPATAQGREVFFQLFRAPTPEADRLLLWEVFQTFIHEYLHTLAHGLYNSYAETFGSNSNEYNTLVEGVDSLLTEIVWTAIEGRVTDPALRQAVEGPANAALPPIAVPHASQARYPSYTEALRLSDLAGIQNLYAAYFLGLVDRIGGPPPPAARRGRP
jgi:hypothetical protein